jgi:RNA polymerase sigma-70 factor (ECF subfamily)
LAFYPVCEGIVFSFSKNSDFAMSNLECNVPGNFYAPLQIPSSYNERELFSRIAGGDEKAFRLLFDAWWDRMYGNILYHCKQPELAEELTQELFVKIWRSRTMLPEIERFDAFLYKIAKHLVLESLRKKVLPQLNEPAFDSYFIDDGLTGIDLLELKELESVLSDAIAHLPAQMQKAFTLHRFHGLSHEEIGREMNISRLSSQTYVARALVQLKEILARHKGEIGLLALILLDL